MKTEIKMPKMGESLFEGTLIKWHKKPGDRIEKDEIFFDISTDKVDSEIPSPVSGIVGEIFIEENQTVPIDTVLAVIETAANAGVRTEIKVRDPEANIKTVAPSNCFLSPSVRRIISEEGITAEELDIIQGTGKGGRKSKEDIEHYLRSRDEQPLSLREMRKPGLETSSSGSMQHAPCEIIEMDNMRRKIMLNTVKSFTTAVHVTGAVEVDMTRIYNYIKANKTSFLENEGIRLTYTPLVTAAAASALKKYPLVNSSIDGTTIIMKRNVNIGIAVALENGGLIVPNIKNTEEKSLLGIIRAVSGIAGKAKENKLSADDISGGTFTISNYGVFGTIFGTPVINPPESAILGMGAVVKRPVVIQAGEDDAIVIKPVMILSLSHDHRLIDGMLGGQFLGHIKEYLENFSV